MNEIISIWHFKKLHLHIQYIKDMKQYILILLALVWIAALAVLIVTYTNLVPNNPFIEYRLIVGIGFIVLTGFIRMVYKRLHIRK